MSDESRAADAVALPVAIEDAQPPSQKKPKQQFATLIAPANADMAYVRSMAESTPYGGFTIDRPCTLSAGAAGSGAAPGAGAASVGFGLRLYLLLLAITLPMGI